MGGDSGRGDSWTVWKNVGAAVGSIRNVQILCAKQFWRFACNDDLLSILLYGYEESDNII